MVKIHWTELALLDLKLIHDYIAQDSKVYAKRFATKLATRVEQLENFLLSGRIVPEYDTSEIRELLEGNYRIVYTIQSNNVNIIRIHHSAKQIT